MKTDNYENSTGVARGALGVARAIPAAVHLLFRTLPALLSEKLFLSLSKELSTTLA